MSEKRPYKIPEFVVQDLNNGQPFSAVEEQEIESILVSADHFQYPATDTETNWQTLRSRIESPMTVSKKPARQFAMFKWAAAAIVVLTLGIGVWQFQKNKTENFTAIYKTEGNREFVKLPDGTTINLNTFTEIEVKTMNSEDRIVALLSGEAFFNVTHNELPFKVLTGKGEVMVTGTEFNIKNRKDLPFSVWLKAGKVKFQTAADQLDMKPGECLKEEGSNQFVITEVQDNNQCAWIANKLVFTSQPLSEIVAELEATYKVKFRYDDKLGAEKYNLVCDNLDAIQVADLLTKLTGSKVSVE